VPDSIGAVSEEVAGEHTPDGISDRLFSAERAKAFIDAVVAIAMTLLILPLMDAATSDVAVEKGAAWWFDHHGSQLLSFVLSFVIIAMFWLNHHRLFASVKLVSTGLLWLNIAWLLSIVWLPVATALSGAMKDTDTFVKAVYIGSMIVTCLLTLLLRLYLRAHTSFHGITDVHLRSGIAVDLSMALLFAVALVVAVLFPLLSYWPLFVMLLTGPLQSLLGRMLGVPKASKSR